MKREAGAFFLFLEPGEESEKNNSSAAPATVIEKNWPNSHCAYFYVLESGAWEGDQFEKCNVFITKTLHKLTRKPGDRPVTTDIVLRRATGRELSKQKLTQPH